jgi:hypothetical protein
MALAEGVKFLYAEASAALKVWHERQSGTQLASTAEVGKEIPPVFAGQLAPPLADLTVVQHLEEPLREAQQDLSELVTGNEKVGSGNADLLARIDLLRTLMEAVLHQRITFQGENRPPSGPLVQSSIKMENLKGYATAVRAKRILNGTITVTAEATSVDSGGQLIGVDISDSVGR